MSSIAIKVENLSKKYLIGSKRNAQDGLRHRIEAAVRNPWRWLSEKKNPEKNGSDEFWAINDVSFQIKQGEVVGIIGRNGAGKSTLLKILSRITEPTSGRINIKGRVASLLEVGTGFHPELTGRENIFLNGAILGMSQKEIKRKFDDIVEFSEIEKFLDTPVKRYSSGMYVRLAFAVAAHLEPEILICDEVLAVGDAQFQKKCLGKMQDVSNEGRTVLFVSHNMGAMLNLCQRGIVFDKGRITFNGRIEEAADFYSRNNVQVHAREKGLEAHVLYQRDSAEQSQEEFAISKVEFLDENKKPKPVVGTWDTFTVRIHYSVSRRIEKGSVVLQLTTADGAPVLLLSTQPDSTLPLSLEIGEHFVDCNLKDFPLSAGDFMVGAGLAIPQVEMLCWKPALGILTIHPKDLYSSGLAPSAKRSLLAINHEWTK
jgi:lipopolysaccharide transport system ATP-binding protein